MKLPAWMRGALLATAAMNLLGGVVFLPGATALRALVGLPEGHPPLYLATVAAFILIFGCAYLWSGATGFAAPQFLVVGAAGKLAFFGLLVWSWTEGAVPGVVPLAGIGDLAFGLACMAYLLTVLPDARRAP